MNQYEMAQLEIKYFYSEAIDDLNNYSPISFDDIYIYLEIGIGTVGDDTPSIYSIIIATPYSIKQRNINIKTSKTKYLIVSQYNWNNIKRKIERMVKNCRYDFEALLRYFNSEYD